MKICFLGDGNSIHIRRWLDFFHERGHEVHLITFSSVVHKNIIVHKIGNFDINISGGNWQYVFSTMQIKKLIKKMNFDIINAHFVTSYGFLASLSGAKPLVVSAWGTDILVAPKKNKIYKAITKYALNSAQLITSDSNFMSEAIHQLTNTDVLTVPMGVDQSLCYKDRKESTDEIKILSLRTVNVNSNIDIIVKAFAKLLASNEKYNFKLIITNDGPEMENIKALVKQLNVEKNVDIKGFVNRDDLIDLLYCSHMHITIPDSDSTSVTLLEAMASGIITIASDIPANREWIHHKKNGLITENIDVESLKTSMELALNDSEFKQKASRLSREVILKKAIWDQNMQLVEQKYLALLKNN
ncbi:glycosyltransferase family 4 protein [Clostridium tagluense]|uniref:glycosyltransferase family 4 protein n=1 Tax=Clostridium tagluense TaxID=360422 RepID=UPI001C6E7C26|nr:glycosyltransferase family 4 protein [Clostridium tagluense]MBW9157847.1 glycosyltransferase family 4 protein [Clostridium tagluense]WLC63819.1 glycosyltransferase family 4 protein [Clostridium tagluense]